MGCTNCGDKVYTRDENGHATRELSPTTGVHEEVHAVRAQLQILQQKINELTLENQGLRDKLRAQGE